MKKKIIVLVLCVFFAFSFIACGSSVSQNEYDSIIEERDSLQTQLDNAENQIKFETTYAKLSAKLDEEYNHAKFVLYIAEAASDANAGEATASLDEMYDETKNALDVAYEAGSGVTDIVSDEDVYNTSTEGLQSIFDSWSNFYKTISNIENMLKNS